MKRRKLTRTFLAACSAVALSAVVYGCGGGGGGPAMPGDVDFSGVTGGYTVETGTWTLGAGETVTVGDVTFLCAPGGAGCTLTVLDNGMATYAGDGGVVTAANSAAYGARQEQRAAAGATIAAATTAVAALTVGSADAAVTAAEQAIATAKAAVAAGTMLTTADLAALNGQIAEAEASLATVRP